MEIATQSLHGNGKILHFANKFIIIKQPTPHHNWFNKTHILGLGQLTGMVLSTQVAFIQQMVLKQFHWQH